MQAELRTPIREPRWPASPTAALFRTDFRRLWNDRTLRTSLKALAIIFLLQFVVGLLLERGLPVGSRVAWNPVYRLAGALGLDVGWPTALLSSMGQLAPGVTHHSAYPTWLMILLGLMYVPLRMIAPAFAAQSVAPDRENGRLEELLLAGYTPRQLLLAKGMAALSPFLLLWLVLEVVNLGMQVYWILHYPTTPGQPGPPPGTLWWSFGFQFLSGFSTLALYGVMVCVSALCRRSRHALLGCYGVAFFWPLLTQAILSVLPNASANQFVFRTLYLGVGGLILSLGVLASLWPKALHALAEPDAAPAPPRRRMRIMEYGAEEADEVNE